MSASFFDTNVLVYAASSNERKAYQADALLAAGGVTSVQVLNEFVSVTHGKLKRSLADAQAYLTAVRHLVRVVPVTIEVHDVGMSLAAKHHLHIYDAMIVAAALHANCRTLYSEDMHDGLLIDGRLRVTNPFAVAT